MQQGDTQPTSARPRRPFRPYVASICLVVALQFLNFTFFNPVGKSAIPEVHAVSPSQIAYTDVNPYGANTFLSREVEDWKREKTVQMMAEAGLGWMKQQFPWTEIEPKQGRFWDDKYNQNSWEKYDRIVSLAEQNGLRVIARLDNTPEWARPPGTNFQTPPSDPELFANFVATFVEHYRGRVQYLQIWNEPNLKAEWGNQVNATAYADLLARAYRRAKAVDPNIVILSAPLAQTLEQGDRGLSDLVYLQQLYAAGTASSFDILMANGYGFDQPPDAMPDPGKLNLRRVELLRQIMERNGDGAKPIWLNEYGWNAAPASFPQAKTPWFRVSEEQQAAYTSEGIRYMREHWPWLGVVNIWYFRQVGDISANDAEYYFRMVDPEFTRRPVYTQIASDTKTQRLALPGRYGVLAPPILARGRWSAIRSPAARPPVLRSMRANNDITIHFKGNELILEVERVPNGGRLGVTVDGSTDTVRHLPQDDRGRRYIDLSSSATEASTTITIVSGLDAWGTLSEHNVVLTTLPSADGSNGAVTISGVEVRYVRSSAIFLVISGISALLALVIIIRIIQSIVSLRRQRTNISGPAHV